MGAVRLKTDQKVKDLFIFKRIKLNSSLGVSISLYKSFLLFLIIKSALPPFFKHVPSPSPCKKKRDTEYL